MSNKYRPPGLRKKPSTQPERSPPESALTPSSKNHTSPSRATSTPTKSKPKPSTVQDRLARFQTPPPQPYGLASRGDHRLKDSTDAQHEFYDRILAAADAEAEIDTILADLRKLREAMLHAGPSPFLKQVFLYSVRIAAPAGQYQTYVPCITYLLQQASLLVTPAERVELALLLALQLAHGAGDNSAAFAVFFAHLDARAAPRVYQALHAWVRDDYWQWLEVYNGETDPAKHAIMTGGLAAMLRRMAHVLTAAYFQLGRTELERKFLPRGTTAAEFAAAYAPQWEVGDTVILRRR